MNLLLHTHNGILRSHKKSEIMPDGSNRDESRDYQVRSERQIPHDVTYMCNIKSDTNELFHKTETVRHTQRQTGGSQGKGVEGGMEWGAGVSKRKLSYVDQIHRALLCRTGNCVQQPGESHNREECSPTSLHCSPGSVATPLTGYTPTQNKELNKGRMYTHHFTDRSI